MKIIHVYYITNRLACQGGNTMKESSHNMGFCRLPFELLADENLTASDAVVYAVLLDACTDTLNCTMALSTIVELTRLSNRAVHYCLDHLEQCGYIERNRTGRETVYRLADIIGLKRQTQKPVIRQSRRAPEEVPAEEQQELKLKYGQFQTVELTMNQFDKLVSDFGETKTLAYIRKCDEYCYEHSKRYSDCDFTIRKWIAEDASKPVQKAEKDAERKERVQKYMELVN